MNKNEFMIELNGIIGTIHTYTRNPFMIGYTKELEKAITNDDLDTAKIVLDKVIEWYDDKICEIQNDKLIFNKDMHNKAYTILHKYRQSI